MTISRDGQHDAAGATPLTNEDIDGLIPTFVATRADLNLAEQANIETATLWAFGRRRVASTDRLLTIAYADRVHQRMFADAWKWAGQHRTRMTNIGVEPHQITTQMKLLFDDARYWHDHSTYEPAERAVRLHHRLVSIHPYRNGNGRHARFMADLYLHLNRLPRLTWGTGQNIEIDGTARRSYINALQAADRGDIEALLDFARR